MAQSENNKVHLLIKHSNGFLCVCAHVCVCVHAAQLSNRTHITRVLKDRIIQKFCSITFTIPQVIITCSSTSKVATWFVIDKTNCLKALTYYTDFCACMLLILCKTSTCRLLCVCTVWSLCKTFTLDLQNFKMTLLCRCFRDVVPHRLVLLSLQIKLGLLRQYCLQQPSSTWKTVG